MLLRILKCLDAFSDYSLVSCRLETGRTHQIRAHMEFIKHPIVNDPLYHPKGKHCNLNLVNFNTREHLALHIQ